MEERSGGYEAVLSLTGEKIRRAEAHLQRTLPTALKNTTKCFYKYISSHRGAKDDCHPFFNERRNAVTTDEEKTEALHAFLASVFSSKTGCLPGARPPEPEDGERNEAPVTRRERATDLLHR